MDMSTSEPTNSDLRNQLKSIEKEIQELYLLDTIPWVIGYSGGKDSTATLQLVWWALSKLKPSERKKTVHVISTDTLVESPVVSAWVDLSLSRMREAAAKNQMPIEAHLLQPEISQTFWVNLIGRGYPAPRQNFRWCTERMKIQPSNTFIRNMVRANGEAILVLGTRKAESVRRASTMAKHEKRRYRDKLSPNAALPNSLVYTPIEDWTNDDVWMYLMQVPNAWGHTNRDLMTMYRGASSDNECPLVVDKSTPTCGNSRFGCWTCTLVDKDRSMEAMIQNDQEKEWMAPLLDIRNELAKLHPETGKWDDSDRRDFRRMNGRVQIYEAHDGTLKPIPGPYTKKWREHWLRRVLETQTDVREDAPEVAKNLELIRLEELREIRRIWLTEKHEFDDAVPRIYKEATGLDFPDPTVAQNSLGPTEWALLNEVCGGDDLLLELMSKLLNTEQQFLTMSRRIGVYKELENILNRYGFKDREEAVTEALGHKRGQIGIDAEDDSLSDPLIRRIDGPDNSDHQLPLEMSGTKAEQR